MGKFKKSTKNNVKFIESDKLYERFIEKDSWIVKIHDLVDFEYFRPILEPLYSEQGRNAYDCIFMFKICILQYLDGGLSDRKVIHKVKTDMEYRYFLDMAIDDEVPYFTKLSDFRTRVSEEKFEELFDKFVEMISDLNIISPEDKRYMDATHQLADVSNVSINVLLSQAIKNSLSILEKNNGTIKNKLNMNVKEFILSDKEKKFRFVKLVKFAQKIKIKLDELMKTKPNKEIEEALNILSRILKERTHIFPGGKIKLQNSNDTGKLASMTDKDATWGSKSKNFQFLGYKHNMSVTENGFIDTISTHQGHESDNNFYKKDAIKSGAKKQIADSKYGTLENRQWSKVHNIELVAPVRKNMTAHYYHLIMDDALLYSHTKKYIREMKQRGAIIEGKFGVMKTQHGFSRAKYRGINKVFIQAIITAFVMNLKNLVTLLT